VSRLQSAVREGRGTRWRRDHGFAEHTYESAAGDRGDGRCHRQSADRADRRNGAALWSGRQSGVLIPVKTVNPAAQPTAVAAIQRTLSISP
jgi:hypothetical protein